MENRVKLYRLALRWHLAREAQQVLHNLFGALRFLQNYPQILARTFGQFLIFHQQICEAQNRREWIVHFMRNT